MADDIEREFDFFSDADQAMNVQWKFHTVLPFLKRH